MKNQVTFLLAALVGSWDVGSWLHNWRAGGAFLMAAFVLLAIHNSDNADEDE